MPSNHMLRSIFICIARHTEFEIRSEISWGQTATKKSLVNFLVPRECLFLTRSERRIVDDSPDITKTKVFCMESGCVPWCSAMALSLLSMIPNFVGSYIYISE